VLEPTPRVRAGHFPLAEHWNGTTWSTSLPAEPYTTDNYLYGVATPGSSNVWAAGYYVPAAGGYQTLVEKWNGSSWSISTSANPSTTDSRLQAVAAYNATTGWAVGFYNGGSSIKTLTERTTDSGATWTTVSSPNNTGDNYLYSVTAIPSSGGDMWAGGTFINTEGTAAPFTMKWNHGTSSWSMVSVPSVFESGGNYLKAVKTLADGNAYAVGYYFNVTNQVFQPIAWQWDTVEWNINLPTSVSTTKNNYLQAITFIGGSERHWTLGYVSASSDQTLAEYYVNPTSTWVVTSPNSPGTAENRFSGAEDISGGAGGGGLATIWAVGDYKNTGGVQQTLIERYVEPANSHP
jgi:hypothetical protein